VRNGAFLSPTHVRVLCLSCLVGLLALTGCGDSVGKLTEVKGTVTVDGQKVTQGEVVFHPASPKSGVRMEVKGKISDGSYSMTTNGKPGAPAGSYKVTVNTMVAAAGDSSPISSGTPPPGGAAGPQRQANPKYETLGPTNDLTIDVPSSNYDLKLTR